MRIDPVKQGENNRNVFGVIHLKGRLVYERGPRKDTPRGMGDKREVGKADL